MPAVFEAYFFAVLVLVYAAVILVGGWFVLPSDRRQYWQGRMRAAFKAMTIWRGIQLTVNTQAHALASSIRGTVLSISRFIREHRKAAFLTAALLAAPAIIAPWLASNTTLEGYDDLPATTDPVVVALLNGEQLVLPPALPPELFITRELAIERQEIATASREWMMLDADFRQRLLVVYQLMAKQGYHMTLLEGYRSPERQTLLAKLGTHVTNARAYQSYHQYGLAADSAFYRDGRIVITEKDPWAMEGYHLYGRYAESAGLVWGGRWKMMDFGHVELRKPGVLGR